MSENLRKPKSRAWSIAAALAIGLPLTVLASSGVRMVQNSASQLRTPSNIAWTRELMATATSGDPMRGLFISRRCEQCHGREGFSPESGVPNLAGLENLVIWKQLDDFRSGKRPSGVMQRIAAALTAKDSADVAAYYSMLPSSPDPLDVRAFPEAPDKQANAVSASRLIVGGDSSRGIPPCQACHGPVGYKTGAPSLATQNASYILSQLDSFAAGLRANDINMPMRSIAADLSEDERHAIAEYYGAGYGENPAGATVMQRAEGEHGAQREVQGEKK